MADEALKIWNRAFVEIGVRRISTSSEVSAERDLIDDVWEGVRQSLLSLHPWDGATTITTLTLKDPKPSNAPDRYTKAYPLPTTEGTFLQAWRVNDLAQDEGGQPLWEIFTILDSVLVTYVMTDQSGARLEWTYDLDSDADLAKLQPLVTTALVMQLAVKLARGYQKKESEIRFLEEAANIATRIAMNRNSKQGKPRRGYDRPLVDARL